MVAAGARLAVAAHLDIAVLVRADGHLGERRVGDGGERRVELGDGGLLLGLGGGERVLQRGDLGLQRLGAGRVLGGHRLADLLGERVAALLRGLRRLDRGAAAVVDGQQHSRQRLGAPVRKPWSNAAAFSRIHLMSYMANPKDERNRRRGRPSAPLPPEPRRVTASASLRRGRRVGRALLLDHLHRDDGDFVEEQRRYRKGELADDVGRRQHGGDHEHQHDGVAPLVAQELRRR